METKELYECLRWAKEQGYVYAQRALDELSFLLDKDLKFKKSIWAGGSYYEIFEEIK